jgi:S1-C subfamily serine protease
METRDAIRQSNVLIEIEYPRIGQSSRTVTGSGVIFQKIGEYYYALTNEHVLSPPDGEGLNVEYATLRVFTFGSDDHVSFAIVDVSDKYDLAVIKFSSDDSAISVLNLRGRTEPIVRGEIVLAAGNPRGAPNLVTFGEFLRQGENLVLINEERIPYLCIGHNALILRGSSGGALVDLYGNFLGINTWAATDYDPDNNPGRDAAFAIHRDVVIIYIQSLLCENGEKYFFI